MDIKGKTFRKQEEILQRLFTFSLTTSSINKSSRVALYSLVYVCICHGGLQWADQSATWGVLWVLLNENVKPQNADLVWGYSTTRPRSDSKSIRTLKVLSQ